MNLFQLYFSWKDELSRLPFFLASLALNVVLGMIIFCLLFFVIGFSIAGGRGAIIGSMMIFFAIMIPLFFLALYCSAVLVVKRLHDMGFSGKHVFWIFGLSFLSAVFSTSFSILFQLLFLLLAIAQLGVAAWLLFTPGENRASNLSEVFR